MRVPGLIFAALVTASPMASAIPTTLSFTYEVTQIYLPATSSFDNTHLGEIYSGSMSWDSSLGPLTSTGTAVRRTTASGCLTFTEGVCSDYTGDMPPMVFSYAVDTPRGTYSKIVDWEGYDTSNFQSDAGYSLVSSAQYYHHYSSAELGTRLQMLMLNSNANVLTIDLDDFLPETLNFTQTHVRASCTGTDECGPYVYSPGDWMLSGRVLSAAAVPVPEPSVMMLFSFGLAGMSLAVWCRRARRFTGARQCTTN